MRIVEIRDLDGPNLFLMAPAIKVELADVSTARQAEVASSLSATIERFHRETCQDSPDLTSMVLEEPGHIVVAFTWNHRAYARSLGCWAAQLVIGERDDERQITAELNEVLARAPEDDDAPLVVKSGADRTPIVAITGTNGKTTTSRLIDFVLRFSGHAVGLTSSAGVFINNEQVLQGDYSGPSGAREVLGHQELDFAVLETARGGMLLRGCGYEDADVAVITNVTEDHLGLHGIHSIEGLAAVKAITARNVKSDGFCVLNAGDPHVLAMRDVTPATPVLFGSLRDSEPLVQHIASGGAAVFVDEDGAVIWTDGAAREQITTLADIPMTFNGMASHQVENALAATGALVGLGIPFDQIRDGLKAFKSTAENSKGRLNVFEVENATVIIDFAHNEAGLIHLLKFARNFVKNNGRVVAVVGTAGDREDSAIRAIARRAAETADVVVLKDSLHYLRGREKGEMLEIMRDAARAVNREDLEILESPDERTATLMMLERSQSGDVIAVMCIEDYDFLLKHFKTAGNEIA